MPNNSLYHGSENLKFYGLWLLSQHKLLTKQVFQKFNSLKFLTFVSFCTETASAVKLFRMKFVLFLCKYWQ